MDGEESIQMKRTFPKKPGFFDRSKRGALSRRGMNRNSCTGKMNQVGSENRWMGRDVVTRGIIFERGSSDDSDDDNIVVTGPCRMW